MSKRFISLVIQTMSAITLPNGYGGDIKAEVTLGGAACHVLEFPRPWRVPPHVRLYGFDPQDRYEFRRSPAAPASTVLITRSTQFPATLSADKYLADLAGRKPVRLVSERDWERADSVPVSAVGIPAKDLYLPDEQSSFTYRGHEYFRSSRHWSAVGGTETRLSTAYSWMSLQSFRNLKPPTVRDQSPDRDYGEFYIDVYDTSTGDKRVTIFGHYENWSEGSVFEGIRFIEDRFLFLPIDADRGLKVLVCDMEATK
jgi:hypothetical protein